jgi:Polyketide cyclase / dehydrase and lipid transport
MSESVSTSTTFETRGVPSASDFTSIPLRNRLRLELEAPASEVWELMGDLSRFPEYSEGLERVEVTVDEEGRCTEYTCYFKPVEEGAQGAVSRDVMKWYEPERGYLSVEVDGDTGTETTVAFMTVSPIPGGSRVTFDMHYDAEDLDAMKAYMDEVYEDMARALTNRFGGRVIERNVER